MLTPANPSDAVSLAASISLAYAIGCVTEAKLLLFCFSAAHYDDCCAVLCEVSASIMRTAVCIIVHRLLCFTNLIITCEDSSVAKATLLLGSRDPAFAAVGATDAAFVAFDFPHVTTTVTAADASTVWYHGSNIEVSGCSSMTVARAEPAIK